MSVRTDAKENGEKVTRDYDVGSVGEIRELVSEEKLRFPMVLEWDTSRRYIFTDSALDGIFATCMSQNSTDRISVSTWEI